MVLNLLVDEDHQIQIQEIDFSGTVPAVVKDNEAAIAKATIEYAASLI